MRVATVRKVSSRLGLACFVLVARQWSGADDRTCARQERSLRDRFRQLPAGRTRNYGDRADGAKNSSANVFSGQSEGRVNVPNRCKRPLSATSLSHDGRPNEHRIDEAHLVPYGDSTSAEYQLDGALVSERRAVHRVRTC